MFCSYCGAPMGYRGQRFCLGCGRPVKKPYTAGDVIVSMLKGVCYFAAYFVISNIVQTVYMIAVMTSLEISGTDIFGGAYLGYSEEFWNEFARGFSWVATASYALIIIAYVIFFAIRRKRFADEVGLGRFQLSATPAIAAMGVGMQVVTTVTISILSAFLPWVYNSGEETNQSYEAMFGSGATVGMFVFIAVATPIIEEVVFRGLIYTRLKKAMPRGVALVLSSLAFGIAHGEFIRIVYAAVLGMLLAYLFDKYESLWPSIILHAAFNAVSFAYDYLPDSGLVIISIYFIAIGLTLVGVAYFFMSEPIYRKEKQINEAL